MPSIMDDIDAPAEDSLWETRATVNADFPPAATARAGQGFVGATGPDSIDLPPEIPWWMEDRGTIVGDRDKAPVVAPGGSGTLGDELLNPFEGESVGDGVVNPFASDHDIDGVINPFDELCADLE